MAVAGVTCVVFFLCTAFMLVGACDLNPVAQGLMSSPAAATRVKVLIFKVGSSSSSSSTRVGLSRGCG